MLSGWDPRQGAVLDEPVEVRPRPELLDGREVQDNRHIKLMRRGMVLVLWRCPVCRTDDALVHKRPLIGRKSVICNACGTRWDVHREIGKDYRLKVLDGPSNLIGLEARVS